jgi:hypothetical protein
MSTMSWRRRIPLAKVTARSCSPIETDVTSPGTSRVWTASTARIAAQTKSGGAATSKRFGHGGHAGVSCLPCVCPMCRANSATTARVRPGGRETPAPRRHASCADCSAPPAFATFHAVPSG